MADGLTIGCTERGKSTLTFGSRGACGTLRTVVVEWEGVVRGFCDALRGG